jgi:pimeloyl-ACP methyl ester carboxylesterase
MWIDMDGQKTFVATGGQPIRPELPAVVLVHGAGLDHSVWALQSRWLAHHGRNVLAVDLPGHGRSAGAPLRTIADMADFIVRLLDAAGIAQAALVGHSMGSFVALEAASRHPTRIRALGLIGTAAAMPVHPDLLAAAEANSPDAIAMLTIWGTGFAAGLGGCRAPGMWMSGGAEAVWHRAAPGVLHTDLAACDAYKGAPQAAAAVSCTVVIVQGNRDVMTPPRSTQTLAKAMPAATTTVLDGAGHMLLSERPDEVLAALGGI